MNLMPLLDRLQAAGLGTKGTTLFMNVMPADLEQGTMLRDKLTGTPIDYELPGYYRADFQVIVRSYDYTAGETLLNNVIASLTLQETQVGTLFIRFMRPANKPVVFPLSNGNVLEFTVRFDVTYLES